MAPPKKKSKNAVDPTWNHCVRATELTDPEAVDNTRLKLVCNYCGKTLSGGVSRMKHHLARTHHNAKPCENVPEDVTNMFLKILGELKQRNCIEQDDVDCFDEMENVISKRGKALPFSLVKSSWFHTAVQSIGEYGKGLKPPSYHEVRVTFLKKEVDNVHSTLDKYKSEWKKIGLWWESYGGSCKELQELATRVLSLTCSATGCERNWSTFQHIHSKKRNWSEAQRLNALVLVKYNLTLELRQKKREENGDAYDPICLSDMESDDEWITEREDPCLPLDPSWMDMNECFEVNEGETSRKGRRGPKNLQNDRKGKRKFVGEENEVEIIDDDVEEEIEEEEEEEEYIYW
ncbi:hypothetical protein RHGRI_003943 [Rhododendron griersonianum]|uniref:BED-type domain-containing protein n=1 Tax=Rhododendron griersonianum TaxID=479676 RepID=A0AAV6L7Z2_9ERIC|nr:hypothetical protein RHGRI_003943 [Rhododendron griersonianum]